MPLPTIQPCRAICQRSSGKGVAGSAKDANVASYDYSAVLYLNGKGSVASGGFRGGDFHFVDEESDEVVEPRSGRCVLFSSGYEQLHRVCKVEGGNRFALAAWFTLDQKASDGPVDTMPFDLVHPVPPPSKEEREADATNVDELRSMVEKKMESDQVVQRLYPTELKKGQVES